MPDRDIKRMLEKLERVINSERARGITYVEMVGCLEIVKHQLLEEEIEVGEDIDEGESE